MKNHHETKPEDPTVTAVKSPASQKAATDHHFGERGPRFLKKGPENRMVEAVLWEGDVAAIECLHIPPIKWNKGRGDSLEITNRSGGPVVVSKGCYVLKLDDGNFAECRADLFAEQYIEAPAEMRDEDLKNGTDGRAAQPTIKRSEA